MTEKEALKAEIEVLLDGIKVQWQDVARQTDPKLAQEKRNGVFATMDMVGEMMREYWAMSDDGE